MNFPTGSKPDSGNDSFPEGSFSSRRSWRESKRDKVRALAERDRDRGYSINVKLVILAFAIEFVIIGLILSGQIFLVLETSQRFVYSAMLFPIALAVVEFARVPLAIAVRTAQSWNIQLAALFGVSCAVVVTSASLYQIGHNTFNPRLENVHVTRTHLQEATGRKDEFLRWKEQAETVIQKLRENRETLEKRYSTIATELQRQPSQVCVPGQKRNPDGTETTIQLCRVNPALKTLQTELTETKKKLEQAESAVRGAEAKLIIEMKTGTAHDDAVRTVEREYRQAVYQSPLHAYTAMLFGKDARDVTEGEVKTLQWYLILLPSIAAALASTLIAMTAVRRIRPRDQQPVVALPDEAVAYLFGPLVKAIRSEAKDAVEAAIDRSAKESPTKTSPNLVPG